MAGRAGAMVGALKALRAERARYRRELDDYRREAAAALRSLPPSVPRVEVERPGPPEELQGILAEAVRNSQTRKGKGKRSGVPRSPDTAVWKDVSNVLESRERHLPASLWPDSRSGQLGRGGVVVEGGRRGCGPDAG